MVVTEELKCYPFGDVWNYFCEENGVPVKEAWFESVLAYEKDVLSRRQ